MRADDTVPDCWKQVSPRAGVEGRLVRSDVHGLLDSSLQPPLILVQDLSVLEVHCVASAINVEMFGHLRLVHTTGPFVFQKSGPQRAFCLTNVKLLARLSTTLTWDMVYAPSDITFLRLILRVD